MASPIKWLAVVLVPLMAGALGCRSAGIAEEAAVPETASPTAQRAPLPTQFGPIALVRLNDGPASDQTGEEAYQLHAGIAEGLQELDLPNEGDYKLSAKVVNLSSEASAQNITAACEVHMTVTHADRGLIATMKGRARAEDAADERERAEHSAIFAAAKSSLKGLTAALTD